MPSRKRLVYVEIGGGEHLNSSVSSWFLPSYPVDRNTFNVYFVDHNASVLLSGVAFIYYPGLAGVEATLNPDVEEFDQSVEDEGFDFLDWFKQTVQHADFVVLKMKAGKVELRFLSGLFQSGAVCFIDELFLSCSDQVGGDCMDLFKSLRSSGVFVHQSSALFQLKLLVTIPWRHPGLLYAWALKLNNQPLSFMLLNKLLSAFKMLFVKSCGGVSQNMMLRKAIN
ncbi:hypothetical protein NC653_037116 [Populus alba x Populus x berolinensis]|uniref:DUF7870 domain-containing protein n=1 Tax=Populus alba x Populus x berolinensis TaxID=444605 RepID=A0AAD6PWL3_9ROSI|nr:hypothetical protein NC653_037116 [Populus alba x Populus x berolinensis]